jgi:hypothetical protein
MKLSSAVLMASLLFGCQIGVERPQTPPAPTPSTAAATPAPAAARPVPPPPIPPIMPDAGATTVEAVLVESGPAIDGALADPAWEKCPPMGFVNAEMNHGQGPQTTARVLYDAENLYVAFDCIDADTEGLVADATKEQDLWKDDCVELYISTNGADYYHYAVNSKGFSGATKADQDGLRDARWKSHALIKASIEKGAGWSVTMRIPVDDLSAKAGENQNWLLNLNRTKPKGSGGQSETTWSTRGTSKYDDMSTWGCLIGVNIR